MDLAFVFEVYFALGVRKSSQFKMADKKKVRWS